MRSIEDVEPVAEHNGTVPVWWLVNPREMHANTGSVAGGRGVMRGAFIDRRRTLTPASYQCHPGSFSR